MEKKFLVEYGYRWADRKQIEIVCTEDKINDIAYGIYLGWLPNSPRKDCGFCRITPQDNPNSAWNIADCM